MLTDVLLPGNRWDLLADRPVPAPTVTAIVTHYEQHRQLALVVAALAAQTLRPTQLVIADDGSAELPDVSAWPGETLVVTQPDEGFRAGAARNRAAREAIGEVLVLLDADTVPEPDYVRALVRTAALCPDVLAVGRRRHADLSAMPPGGDPHAAPRLDEPAWLADAHAASRDLLDADGRSFRYLIGAVMACRRSLFEELGGFDERYTGYGGEDWDLAYRAWNAGAVLVHERAAVAWHDGPDWAGRDEDRAVQDRQSARLASLVPEPATRGAPLPYAIPDVLVDLDPDQDWPDAARTVHSLLRQTAPDLAVRAPRDPMLAELYAGAPVRTDPWTADQLARARARLRVHAPLPRTAVADAVRLLTEEGAGRVELCWDGNLLAVAESTRALRRAARWNDEAVVESCFGVRRLDPGPGPDPRRTLAGFFEK